MTERRKHLVLVGLILAALAGSLLLAVPGSPLYKSPTLGLDLQGGLEVVLKAVPPEGRQLTDADLDRSLEIIRNRVDKIGVAEPDVRKQGSDEINVALPGVDNAERARDLIGQTAKLELFDLETALTGPSVNAQGFPVPQENLYDLLASAQTQSLVSKNGADAYYLFSAPGENRQGGKKLLAGPLPSEEAIKNAEAYEEEGTRIFAVPKQTQIVTCGSSRDVCPGVGQLVGPNQRFLYLFKYTPDAEQLENRFPQMTGEQLELSGTRQDFDPQTGQPVVLMQFTDRGADIFHEITRAEAVRGQSRYNLLGAGSGADPEQFNQHFAIVLDDELVTFPSINFREYPDGISGTNGAQITGIGNVREAQDIALVLQTGALPVEFQTLSETQISATLGEDSLREALQAAIVGLVVVAIFLLLFYRFLGLVAVLGLGIYAVFLYAMILVFNVTLTLPGFAGMILTIGVAADANVVIFERIKEEARGGKSVRAAISTGYAKGFHTIVDANVVTAITALVLFVLATAGVKGFALMLLIGTAMSLVTAVFATRAMLGLLAGFRWFSSPKFMGATGVQIPNWIRHDYVGKRKIWFAISTVVLLAALVSIGVRGLNLGIDFEGGTKVTFATDQPQTIETVRAQAERVGQGNAVIQGVGEELAGSRYAQFQVSSEALSTADQGRLRTALQQNAALEEDSFNVTTVSASFGRQIATSAGYAIVFSLFLVVLYIAFRFQWKFAVAVIAALLHDILIAVGIYSISGKEVSTATVAAILTVLGYSIYDTIIILDRVRENMPLMRRATFPQIANVSLWETIRRSLATTFITLLPITALYLFGGETLKDFAFALLVGIGSGAYSSIFIAAPLVSWFKEREPEYARRRPDAELGKEVGAPPVEPVVPEQQPAPKPAPALAAAAAPTPTAASRDRRERRRQRRRAHGRPR